MAALTRRLKSTPHVYEGWNAMPDQPKVCYLCGEPVRLKGESVGFRTSDPKQSWHFRCLMEAGTPPLYGLDERRVL